MNFKNIISIQDLDLEHINLLIDIAQSIDINYSSTELLKKKILLFFLEPSTRTKLSFEIAAKNLSAETINFDTDSSSFKKGETILDTVRTLKHMGIDLIIVRNKQENTANDISNLIDIPLINAGDGINQHPTQALLDFLTIKETFKDFSNLRVTICGDISHSRVAKSNIDLFNKFNIPIAICAPEQFIPIGLENLKRFSNIDDASKNSNLIISLRVQKERINSNIEDIVNSYKSYQIRKEHLDKNPDLFIMHPGPVNYGLEIEEGLWSHKRVLIDKQVSNGVRMRMAILKTLLYK